jgi:uncharacterized RDD family membrane protein YckC
MTSQAQAASLSEEELYIASVIDRVPQAPSLRAQIAMDLRSHIAERMDHGQSIDEVVRQLGDPERLAESYLGVVPLVAPDNWARLLAKLVDFAIITGVALVTGLIVAAVLVTIFDAQMAVFAVPISMGLGTVALIVYPLVAEYRSGQTLGKRIHRLRVVQESGARITVGQSIVRQLPWLFQVFVTDCAFALFTEKSQRAAEILSKTRVVRVPSNEES